MSQDTTAREIVKTELYSIAKMQTHFDGFFCDFDVFSDPKLVGTPSTKGFAKKGIRNI